MPALNQIFRTLFFCSLDSTSSRSIMLPFRSEPSARWAYSKRLMAPTLACAGERIIIPPMKQFTAIVHRGEPNEGGFWATYLEVPGANGQGETRTECLDDLKAAIQLLLDIEREEVLRLDPQAETELVVLA